MSDRYLFCAKRIDNGEWIVGSLIQTPYLGSIRSWISSEQEDKERLREISSNQAVLRAFEVRTDTVCQCTGLKDKNGKLIWENDIIKCKEIITTVLWSTKYASYALTRKGWLYDHFFGESQNPEECEVIGNIFDEGSENIGKGAEEN